MRIALNGYIGAKKTGIGVVTEEFLSELLKNNEEGHDYYVFCNYDSQLTLPNSRALKLIRYQVSRKSSFLNLLWTIFLFPWYCWWHQVDLSIIPNVTCLIFKACPTIVMIHDLIEFKVPKKFSRLRMIYRHIAVPLTARRADRIVTVSDASKHDIVNDLGIHEEKVTRIYSGLSSRFKDIINQENPKLNGNSKIPGDYMLYVGTIDHPGKNGIALIKIYVNLPDYLKKKLYVVYAGKPGPGFEYIKNEVEANGITDRVIFLGFVPDEDLPGLYKKCVAFIFPSRYEGFGLPVIEAMAWGAPVITAKNSGLIEAAGDAGLLYDADDIQGMAQGVDKIFNDQEYREQLIRLGEEHAKRFSWDENCRQWKRIINRFAGESSEKRGAYQ